MQECQQLYEKRFAVKRLQQLSTTTQVFNIWHQSIAPFSHAGGARSEDRDKAFELLEAYIERESESGDAAADYDRIRGLVPHMRKRLWKASSKEQVPQIFTIRTLVPKC